MRAHGLIDRFYDVCLVLGLLEPLAEMPQGTCELVDAAPIAQCRAAVLGPMSIEGISDFDRRGACDSRPVSVKCPSLVTFVLKTAASGFLTVFHVPDLIGR